MIEGSDVYRVVSATCPLYIPVILGYGSVRWWKLFNEDQIVGVNRFVFFFAVPFLVFKVISNVDLYKIDYKFIGADALAKIFVIFILAIWIFFFLPKKASRKWALEWAATVFLIFAFNNSLIIGVPVIESMYGTLARTLMSQLVAIQVIVWYTATVLIFEIWAAKKESFEKIQSFRESFRQNLKENSDTREKQNASFTSKVANFNANVANFDDRTLSEENSKQSQTNEKTELTNSPDIEITFYNDASKTSNNNINNDGADDYNDGNYNNKNNERTNKLKDAQNSSPNVSTSINSETKHYERNLSLSATDASKLEHNLEEPISEKEKVIDVISAENKFLPPENWGQIEKNLEKEFQVGTILFRKLVANPSLHSSLYGVIYSLIAFGFDFKMPLLLKNNLDIIANTGMGMAMFSLGLFIASPRNFESCGVWRVTWTMMIRLLACPVITAAFSYALALHGRVLYISILQGALPQAVLSFVLSNEYKIHPEIHTALIVVTTGLCFPLMLLMYMAFESL